MKNSAILILFFTNILLSPTIMNGQDSDQSRMRLGLTASLENNTSSETIFFDDVTGFSADYDTSNYRFGLNLEYFFKSKLTINTAINYSNNDFTGTYFCFVCDFAAPPDPEDVNFRFIEVPITMKYYFLPGKFKLFAEAGFNNLFALNNLGYDARKNSYILGLKAGGGVEFSLSQQLALQFKVDFDNSSSRVLKDSDFALESLHIGFGLFKRL